jgi:hypothetical protein
MSSEFLTLHSALMAQNSAGMALDLLASRDMTQTQWLLLGAVVLGIAIVVYFVFLCPTECH